MTIFLTSLSYHLILGTPLKAIGKALLLAALARRQRADDVRGQPRERARAPLLGRGLRDRDAEGELHVRRRDGDAVLVARDEEVAEHGDGGAARRGAARRGQGGGKGITRGSDEHRARLPPRAAGCPARHALPGAFPPLIRMGLEVEEVVGRVHSGDDTCPPCKWKESGCAWRRGGIGRSRRCRQ